jgi:hypothetical protein
LFAEPSERKDARLDSALDAVRARFGESAIMRARMAAPDAGEGKKD